MGSYYDGGGYGGSWGSSFALIVVLFILLIIVGTAFINQFLLKFKKFDVLCKIGINNQVKV